MSTIDSIVSNNPSNVMRLELFLSDYCNYQCWYCSKDFNGRTTRWPKLDVLLPNFLHLLDYYVAYGKNKFVIHIGGGEPSQWPNLVEFVSGVKKHHNCIISLTTNGSRTVRWWNENVKHFDHVGLSVHHEQVDAAHLATVGDIIYKNKVAVWASVLMDSAAWDKCIGIIDTLKKSRYKWAITSDQIHAENINYTDEQKKYLNKRTQRANSIFYDLFVNNKKRPRYEKPTVHIDNHYKKVPTTWLLLNGYNNFKGWSCNVGVDTAFIDKTGNIRGSCGNKLFNEDFYYNIFDEDFKIKFKPNIKPVVCEMTSCVCQPETNCTKSQSLV